MAMDFEFYEFVKKRFYNTYPKYYVSWIPTKKLSSHYYDVIMSTMASQITSISNRSQPFVQAQIKENIKAPRHWPLCGEFAGHRWILYTKGQ